MTKARILIVDDEPMVLAIAEKMLEYLGHYVKTYREGKNAIEALLAEPEGFDLVVADVLMPGMTGNELALRIHELRPDLPVIFFTGGCEDEKFACFAGDAAPMVLPKPVQLKELELAIQSALDSQGHKETRARHHGGAPFESIEER